MTKTCIKCALPIPEERLLLLPHTQVCVKCSQQRKYVGFSVYSHKTAPTLEFCDPDDRQAMDILNKGYKRQR